MKKLAKFFLFLAIGLVPMTLSSCGSKNQSSSNNESQEQSQKVHVSNVYFTLDKTELDIGETANINNITVNPNNATDTRVYFSVSNNSVLKVSNNVVTAVGYGSAYVSCFSIDNPSATYKVKVDVVGRHVRSISLSLDKESMEVSEFCNATVEISPSTAVNKDYLLIANPNNLVRIEGTKITGIRTGTCSIKAKSLENGTESNSVSLEIKDVTARGIILNCDKTTLEVGETSTLSYTVQPENAVDKEVAFKTESGKSDVISISSSGVVSAVGVGEDYAVAYIKNKPEVFNKIKFIVVSNPVTSITASVYKTEIEALETVQINVEVLPSDASDKSVVFEIKSGTNDVIKVSKTGLVTGVHPGEDSVVCYSKGNPTIKDEIKFTVKETPAGEISVSKTEVSSMLGDTYQINATVLPENATDKELAYKAIDRNTFEDKGERFESGVDYSYNFAKPIMLNEKLVIDLSFDKGERQKICLMLGQGWDNYYGYFNIYNDGSMDSNYDGVSVSEPAEGIFRVTFDLTEVNKINDKPAPDECISMVYIRGSWSLASGSIKVNPEIKKDIVSVSQTGLVTCKYLGEQKVRVYLKNHPSIFKDINFTISKNPNDPIGEDIFEF